MKKILLQLSFVVVSAAALVLYGCSKDDTTAPVITLTGDSHIHLVLNSTSTWTDLGATATDDEDETVTVTSDASATNPDMDRAGTYIIRYTCTDEAGNYATVIEREIEVYNEAEIFEGNYNNCVDTCATTPNSQFNAIVTASDSVNNLVSINGFGAFDTLVNVFASFSAITNGSTINVATGQSLGGSAQINLAYPADSKITSANPSSTAFKIKYGWTDGTNSDICESTYIR